jgi:protein-L-isoaspartate(D-aspartate) O-methyltransferase
MTKEKRSDDEMLRALRREMVQTQMRQRNIRDERVLSALEEVPRELFVPLDHRHLAFEDCPLPIGGGQTISQPYIVALMVQELRVQGGHRVLDVGAGSGYQAAVLSRLAGHVYAVERLPELAERARTLLAGLGAANVTIRVGDGTLGWPEEAPFDGIICGAAAPDIPPAWIEQLAEGGRIVAPVGGADSQDLLVAQKLQGQLHRRHVCGVRFVKLIGQQGWEENGPQGTEL